MKSKFIKELMKSGLIFAAFLFLFSCLPHSFSQTVLTADGLAAFGTNAASGGGGGSWTLIAHTGQAGTIGSTTSGGIDTTGANLIVVAACHLNNDNLTISDNKGNTYTLKTRNGTTRFAYCISPTVGAGHTFTAGTVAGGASFQVYAFSKSGTPVFDAVPGTDTSSGNWAGGLQQASLTPATASDLFLSAITFDTITGSGNSINSSYTGPIDSPKKGSNGLGISSAYKIKSGSSSAEAPTWSESEGSNPSGWCIGICFK